MVSEARAASVVELTSASAATAALAVAAVVVINLVAVRTDVLEK